MRKPPGEADADAKEGGSSSPPRAAAASADSLGGGTAAAVLREIEDGRSSLVPKRPQPWWRRAAILGGTLVVALAMGLFVAHSAGQRLPGQSLTGGQPADEVAVQLATARQSMGTDPKASLEAYAKVLVIQPDNVEAITYAAWLKEARNCAHRYAGIHGTVTSDDVHRLCPPPPWVHHNAMGGIFRTRAFVSVGFVQSKRPSAHARMIREYVLRGA